MDNLLSALFRAYWAENKPGKGSPSRLEHCTTLNCCRLEVHLDNRTGQVSLPEKEVAKEGACPQHGPGAEWFCSLDGFPLSFSWNPLERVKGAGLCLGLKWMSFPPLCSDQLILQSLLRGGAAQSSVLGRPRAWFNTLQSPS